MQPKDKDFPSYLGPVSAMEDNFDFDRSGCSDLPDELCINVFHSGINENHEEAMIRISSSPGSAY